MIYLVNKSDYECTSVVYVSRDKEKAYAFSKLVMGFVSEYEEDKYYIDSSWNNTHSFSWYIKDNNVLGEPEYRTISKYNTYGLNVDSANTYNNTYLITYDMEISETSSDGNIDMVKVFDIFYDVYTRFNNRVKNEGIDKCIEYSYIDNFNW